MRFISRTSGLLCTLGGLIILGTAGASDRGLLPMDRIVLQCAIGVGLMGLGVLLNKLFTRRRKYERNHH